jgi:hypothetical protein
MFVTRSGAINPIAQTANGHSKVSSPERRRTAYAHDVDEIREHPLWRNMATSQNPKPQRRRPSVSDGSATGAATPPDTGPTPDHTTKHDTGHPNARGTLPMARHPSTPPTNTPASDDTSAGVSAQDRALMRARLAAMATQRDSDSPRVAELRAIQRDEALMRTRPPTSSSGHRCPRRKRETLGAAAGGLMAAHMQVAPPDGGGAPWRAVPLCGHGLGRQPAEVVLVVDPHRGRVEPSPPATRRQDRHRA